MIYLKTFESIFGFFKNKKQVTSPIKQFGISGMFGSPASYQNKGYECSEFSKEDISFVYSYFEKDRSVRYRLFSHQKDAILIIFGNTIISESDNKNTWKISKLGDYYIVNGDLKGTNVSVNSIEEACQIIKHNIIIAKVDYAINNITTYIFHKPQGQDYGSSGFITPKKLIENMLEEYSVIRENSINEYRLRSMIEEIIYEAKTNLNESEIKDLIDSIIKKLEEINIDFK